MTDDSHESYSIVSAAAQGAEECGLVRAILDDLTGPKPRAAYLQWLIERADQRASFIDSLNRCANDFNNPQHKRLTGYFPGNSGYSPAWTNMLGYDLFARARFHENWWKARRILLRYARPALAITPQAVGVDNLSVICSRFGGRPSLSPDTQWPECSEGPLSFIGQVALDEIKHTQIARFLPASGWLSFFALDGNVGALRGLREIAGDSRVIYTPGNAALTWREAPTGVSLTHQATCRLVFTEYLDLPGNHDKVVSPEDQDQLASAGLDFDEIRGLREADCHMFGYARHYSTDDPSPAIEFKNLICFASISSLNWNWCDGEHLALFIDGNDLKNQEFGKVWGYAS